MQHGSLAVITQVRAEALATVEQCLDAMGRDPERIFGELPELHFARFVILDRDPDTGEAPREGARLLFSADYVMELPKRGLGFGVGRARVQRALDAAFIDRLVQVVARDEARRALFERLYSGCLGYDGGLAAYLKRHARLYQARHVARPYRAHSSETLRAVLALRRDFDALLDGASGARSLGDADLEDLRSQIQADARHAPLFQGRLHDLTRERERRARLGALWATVRYWPVFHALLWILFRLRWSVTTRLGQRLARGLDRHYGVTHPPRRRVLRAPDSETQNPLVHVATLRWPFLPKPVMWGLGLVDRRLWRYRVGLNRFPGIHCARWFVEGEQVIFLSNYDGSFVDYITAFGDDDDLRSYLGLMWSQTRGFPDIAAPVELEGWIAEREFHPRVWYSAYDRLGRVSIVDVHQALSLWELLDGGTTAALRDYAERGACEPERIYEPWAKALSMSLRGRVAEAS